MNVKPQKIQVSFIEAIRILLPYSWLRIEEQIITVVPVCAYLALFQIVILRHGLTETGWIIGGISVVMLGLAFFMEGIKIGLIPLGEIVGDKLPERAHLAIILIFAFLLGNLAAFGEPVMGSLQIAGAGVDPKKAPLLHTLLLEKPFILVLAITIGVGIATVLGVVRFLKSWSLKPFVLVLVGICAVLSVVVIKNHDLETIIGLAWDSGAVIAGPVLVPIVLSIGLGVCRATGQSDTGMSGFGMVALISLVPIVTVLLTTIVVVGMKMPLDVATVHVNPEMSTSVLSITLSSFFSGFRAIVPIFTFLFLFLHFFLKEEGIPFPQLSLGVAFAIFGLFLFNFGLSVGLGSLGNQVGARLPFTFHPPGESLYPTALGKIIVVLFGGILGYGATIAEPAFNTLGKQVEDVTQGAFKKWIFGQSVALGVGIGAAIGMASLIYKIDLLNVLLPPYFLLFFLTLFSTEKYVNIAWDGGAVTTGPVTVPLKIAIGIALSHATGFAEGFGILALASAYPVVNVLLLGLFVNWQTRKAEVKLQ